MMADNTLESMIRHMLDSMAKPKKSLGILEECITQIVKCLDCIPGDLKPYHMIFASDNGIADENVSEYNSSLNPLLVSNVHAGNAVIACFCDYLEIPYSIHYFTGPNQSFAKGPALNAEMMFDVHDKAHYWVDNISRQGCNLISFGEIGIGNTTTASALLYANTGRLAVGYGSMIASDKRELFKARKEELITKYVKFLPPDEAMIHYGSYEIYALKEAMLHCQKIRIPFVIDGFATAVALLYAWKDDAGVLEYAIPSHRSTEADGIIITLAELGCSNIPLNLGLGLGEGTGAVLLVKMIQTAYYAMMNCAKL